MIKFYKLFLCLVPFLFSFKEAPKKALSQEKQTLHINFAAGGPKFIHPHLQRDSESLTLSKALFEGLTRINLEEKVELALARKIEVSKCKTRYTIYLRPSKWSNGQEITSDHFVKAWKAAFCPGTKCSNPYRFFIIKNVEKVFKKELTMEKVGIYAPNKYQLEIHLEHPASYFTQLLADPIFSPLFDHTKMSASVFNGPFLLKNIRAGKDIQLQKNPLYWDASAVKLETIEFSQITDDTTAYELFQKGKIDYAGSPFSDLPEEILQHAKGVKSAPACAVYWMYMNIKNPKLCSKTIRKALGLAINRDYIAKYILSNANPSDSVLPQDLSSIKYKGSQSSTDQAQELFSKGLQELGLLSKDFSLTLSYTASPRHASIAKYLKHQWEKTFNIRVTLDKSDWSTFFSKLNSASFEVGGAAKYATCLDPLFFLELFYESKMNKSQWENAEFKKWIDLANQCVSKKKLQKCLAKAEEILAEECPVIAIYTHKHLYLCNPKLKNLYPSKLLYQDFKWTYFE